MSSTKSPVILAIVFVSIPASFIFRAIASALARIPRCSTSTNVLPDTSSKILLTFGLGFTIIFFISLTDFSGKYFLILGKNYF